MLLTSSPPLLPPFTLLNTVAGNVPFAIRAASGQTADLQQWQSSTGTVLAKVDASGNCTFGNGTLTNLITTQWVDPNSTNPYIHMQGTNPNQTIAVIARTATQIPWTIQAAASQSADLQQWQNSSGTVLAKVDSGGNLTAQNSFLGAVQCSLVAQTNNAGPYISLGTTALTIISRNDAHVPLTCKANSGTQTADLTRWVASDGTTILGKVDSSGAIAPQNGARITSGSGAPTTPGGINPTAGDIYLRTDTPTIANQRIYICTVGGGTPTWVGLV